MEQNIENREPAYYILHATKMPQNCVLVYKNATARTLHRSLHEGVSYTPKKPIELHFWEDHKGTNIPDYPCTTEAGHVVSNKLKSIMEQHVIGQIEFLPCVIFDHKKRKVVPEGEYWIANLIGLVDCLDRNLSKGGKSGYAMPHEYDVFSCIVLDNKKISADLNLFRLGSRGRLFIIRDDLRAIFEENEIKEIKYIEQGESYFI